MKEKIKKEGFIQIPLLIGTIVSIVVTAGVGYGAFEYHKTSKIIGEAEQLAKEEKYDGAIEKLEFAQNKWSVEKLSIKKKEIAEKIENNRKLLEDKSEYNQGIEEFNKENWDEAKELLSKVFEKSPYYQDAKNKIEEAQNNIVKKQIAEAVEKITKETKRTKEEAQTQTAELEKKIKELGEQPSQSPTVDLVSIIEKWQPRIVYIECDFIYYQRTGSGMVLMSGLQFLLKEFDGEVIVMTNKHIVTDENGYGADSCNVIIGKDSYNIKNLDIRIQPEAEIDLGYMKISNPTKNTKSIANSYFTICETTASIGENVVILGYPYIGSKTSITATEGIISGYENLYYITSAKIDQGNSGGAGILLKNDCYLGIPTYVILGKIESLGRIFNVSEYFIWP